MAQNTLTEPDNDKKLSKAVNPADKEFQNIVDNYGKTANASQEDGNINKLKNAESSPEKPANQMRQGGIGGTGLSQKEKPSSAAEGAALAAASQINPVVGTAAKALSFLRTRRGAGIGGGLVAIAGALLIVSSFLPSAIVISAKENGMRWSTKFQNIGNNYRVRQHMQSRYFTNPDECRGYQVKCRYQSGTSEKELKKLRDQGFTVDTAKTADGQKTYITKMSFTTVGGKELVLDKDTFKQLHKTNPEIRLAMNRVINPTAIGARNDTALKKLVNLNVFRNKIFGEGGTKEEMVRKFREHIYGGGLGGTNVKLNNNSEALGEDSDAKSQESLTGINQIDGAIAEQAAAIKETLVKDGPPNLVPDYELLNDTEGMVKYGDAAKATIGGATKGGLKGTLMGFFGAADTYCSIYRGVRLMSYGAKILAAQALIRYAAMFVVVAEQYKAGDGDTRALPFLAGIFLRQSSMPASKGLDFSNSAGVSLINEGKVANPNSLARFSVGTTAMKVLDVLQRVMNGKQVSSQTCSKIKSWYGQLGLFAAGIAVCVFTVGAGCAEGFVQGVVTGAIMGFVMEFVTTKMIAMAAGATAPDAQTDPEGGFGAGNAFAAGVAAFGGELSKTSGMHPMSQEEFAQVAQATTVEQRTIAVVEKMEDREKGIFSPENPNSVTNKMALALSPILGGSQNLTQLSTGLGTIMTNGFAAIPSALSPTTYAAETISEDKTYGGQYCKDEDLDNLKLARTAFCNPIYGPFADVLEGAQYTPEAVATYLADNKHIDPDTGEIISEEFSDFTDRCVNKMLPYTNDGFGIDLEDEGSNTEACVKTDTLHKAFWAYTQDQALRSGQGDAIDDTLGVDADITPGAPLGGAATSGGSLIMGDTRTLAQKIMALQSQGQVGGDSRYIAQIAAYARGDTTCNINPLVLQLILTAAAPAAEGGLGHKIYITSLNRRCTGVVTASGYTSRHWRDGGGHAVDIGIVDGVRSTGGTANDVKLLRGLIPRIPQPSGQGSEPFQIGQIGCRSGANTLSTPAYIDQITDTCNHIHIGVPVR